MNTGIYEWLKEKNLRCQLQPWNTWRNRANVFKALNYNSKQACLVVVIRDKADEILFSEDSSDGKTKFNLPSFIPYPIDQYKVDGKLSVIILEKQGKSLTSWLADISKEQISSKRFAQFGWRLLEFQKILVSRGCNLADQADNLLFRKEDAVKLLPISVNEKNFKEHVFKQYLQSITEQKIFLYPPETLYSALSLEDGECIERGDSAEVWAIGVLLFAFVGGNSSTILKLADYSKKESALKAIEECSLSLLFSRLFESAPIRRMTLKELERRFIQMRKQENEIELKKVENQVEEGKQQKKLLQLKSEAGCLSIDSLVALSKPYFKNKLFQKGILHFEGCLKDITAQSGVSQKLIDIQSQRICKQLGKMYLLQGGKSLSLTFHGKKSTLGESGSQETVMSDKKKSLMSLSCREDPSLSDWKAIWKTYIRGSILQTLPREQQYLLYVSIKDCLDLIINELGATPNADIKYSYRRALMNLDFYSFGIFLCCVHCQADESKNSKLCEEISSAIEQSLLDLDTLEGQNKEIIQEYVDELLSYDKNNTQLLYFTAEKHFHNKNFQETTNVLKRLLAVNPEHPQAHFLMAKTAKSQNQLQLCLQYLKRCFKIDPKKYDAHLYLSEIYKSKKNLNKTARELCVCMKQDPSDSGLSMSLAEIWIALKTKKKSLVKVKKYIRRTSITTKEFAFNLGSAFEKLSEFEAAMEEYKQEINSNSLHLDSYLRLTQLQETSGNLDEAIKILELCLSLIPDTTGTIYEKLIGLLKISNQSNRLHEIVNQYGKGLQETIRNSCVMRTAMEKFEKKDREESLQYFFLAMKIWSNNPDLKYQIASLFFENSFDFFLASKYMREAVSLQPSNESYRLLLAQILAAEEKFDLAHSELLLLLASSPENPQVLLELGKVLHHKKHYNEAFQMLSTGLSLCNTSVAIRTALGVVCFKLKKLTLSLMYFEGSRVVSKDSNPVKGDSVEIIYGKCLYFSKQYAQAFSVFQQYFKCKDLEKYPTVLFYLGMCNRELGKKSASFFMDCAVKSKKQKQQILSLKLALQSKLSNNQIKEISSFKKRVISIAESATDPDMCAILCKAELYCNQNHIFAIHYVEQGLQASLFGDDEEAEQKEEQEFELKAKRRDLQFFGCFLFEARINFLMGKNIDTILQKVKLLQDQLLEATANRLEEEAAAADQAEISTKKRSWQVFDWNQDLLLLLAEIFFAKMEFTLASEILMQLEDSSEDTNLQKHIKHLKALILLRTGKEQEGKDALRANTTFHLSCFEVGINLHNEGQHDMARSFFKLTLEMCGESFYYFQKIGDLEFAIKKYDLAIQAYEKYFQLVKAQDQLMEQLHNKGHLLSPRRTRKLLLDVQTVANFGFCYQAQMKIPESMDKFELSLRINPNQPRVLEWLGNSFMLGKQFDKAEETLKKSIGLQPSAEAFYLLGQCYKHFKKYTDEKECYLNAERLDSKHFYSVRSLGGIYHKEEEYAIGQKYYERCATIDKDDQVTFLGLVDCKERIPSSQQTILLTSESNPKEFMKLVLLYKETKMLPQFDYIKSHKQFLTKNTDAIFLLAEMFFAAAETEEKYQKTAETLCLKIISEIQLQYLYEIAISHLRLAQIRFRNKKYNDAFEFIRKFNQWKYDKHKVQLNQSSNTAHSILFQARFLEAQLRLALGKQKVSKLLLECIRIEPQAELPYFYFALHLISKSSFNAAWQFLDKGIKALGNKGCEKGNQNSIKSSELVLFLQAMKVVHTGDTPLGIKMLEQCIEKCSSSWICFFHLGNIYMKQEDYQHAIDNYLCISQSPSEVYELFSPQDKIDCLCSIAIAQQRLKKFKESLVHLEKCLNIDRGNLVALRVQSEIYIEQGEFHKAFQSLQMAFSNENIDSKWYYLLGKVSQKVKNIFTAIKSLQKCAQISQNYDYPQIQLNLGLIYESVGRPQLSLNHYLQYLAYFPNSTLALFRVSRLLVYFKKHNAAKSHIDRLFEILQDTQQLVNKTTSKEITKPTDVNTQKLLDILEDGQLLSEDKDINLGDAYSVLGYLQKQSNNLPEALLAYMEALKINNSEETQFSIALVLNDLGKYSEAITAYEALIARGSSKKLLLHYCVNLGNAYMQIGDFLEAAKAYKKGISEENETYKVLANLGACLLAQNKQGSAIKQLEIAISMERDSHSAHFLLGLAYQSKGDMPNSVKYLEKALKLEETYVPAYLSLAQAQISSERIPEAIQLLQICVQQSPQDLRALSFLGDSQIKAGDYWTALALFEQILQKHFSLEGSSFDKVIEIHTNLSIARIYRYLHEPDKAIDYLKTCLERSINHPAYLHELGTLIIFCKGDLKEALELFKLAAEISPGNAHYLFSISDTLHRLKEYELEISSLHQCLALKPSFEGQIFNNLGIAYESLRLTNQALNAYQSGIKCYPDMCEIHFNYGNLLYEEKKLNEAAQAYEKCITIDPLHYSAYHNLANVSVILHDFQRSAECFRQCLVIQPKQFHHHRNEIVRKIDILAKRGYFMH